MRMMFAPAVLVGSLVAMAPTFASTVTEGVDAALLYTGDFWRNQDGGLQTGNAYLDNVDLTLQLNADKLWGWMGATLYGSALYNNGATFSSSHVGDAQVVTNIETMRALRLFELWYEQQFSDWALTSRVGLYDLNSEFYATESSALFLNAAHGIGTDFSQTGETGPSIFPLTSLALRLQQDLSPVLSWRAAIMDAVPGDPDHPTRTVVKLRGQEGLLAVGELDFHPGTYRLGFGGWRYSKRQERLDGDGGAISWGSYGLAEMALDGGALDETAADAAAVRGFIRAGIAEDSVNRFSNFVGMGLTFSGALWHQPEHRLGVALARARNGSPYRTLAIDAGSPVDTSEMDIEVTYRFPVGDRVVLQPDLQYVMHPDTDPGLDNALVVGIRGELSFF